MSERDDDRKHHLIPGGNLQPARTPGGTGPSTRDAEHAVVGDSNEALVGREKLARDLQGHPQRAEGDPDR